MFFVLFLLEFLFDGKSFSDFSTMPNISNQSTGQSSTTSFAESVCQSFKGLLSSLKMSFHYVPSKKPKVSDPSPLRNGRQLQFPLNLWQTATYLPDELLLKIFDFLTIRQRLTIGRVCRQWRRLSLDGVKEFAVGCKNMESLDRHLAMTNHFICEDEMKRLQVLNLVLNKCGHSLRKLQLGGVDEQKIMLKDRSPVFQKLFGQTVFLLIQNCRQLEVLVFDFGCLFSENTFHFIFQQMGKQLNELYFGDKRILHHSYELALKYLDPNRVKKLAIELGVRPGDPMLDRSKHALKAKKFFLHFRHLTSLAVDAYTWDFETFPDFLDITEFSSNGDFEILLSHKSFLSKLRTFRIKHWPENTMPAQVPNWILHLECLEVLSIRVFHGWQIQLLADHLPNLREFSLELLFLEFDKSLFAQFLKLKNLRVVRLCWNTDFFQQINFERVCSVPHVTFFELVSEFRNPREDLTCLLSNMSRIFPSLQHLDIFGQKFRHETLLGALNQLTELRKFALTTCDTHDDFIRNELSPLCDRKNIQLFWDNRHNCDKKYFDLIEQTFWTGLEKVWRL